MSLQRDPEHTRPGSRLVAERNFLYSFSVSLDVLFSCCISLDGCLPVDLLHCFLLLLHNITSCCCLILTSSTYLTPPKHCPEQFIWLGTLQWYASLSKLICFIRREFLKHFSSHTCTRVICQ